jgi:hypothetical protein
MLRWYPIRIGALMHAKGYGVFQIGRSEAGVICIGSGNATLPGLGTTAKGTAPNIELAYITDESDAVSEFLTIFDHLCKEARDLSEASRREDAYSFTYSLLASGIFLHDWRDSLRSQIGIIYTLTPEGQNQIRLDDEELKQLGFDLDQATINRNPLSGVRFSADRALPRGFARKYTIDTLIGRWCPRSIWTVVEENIERDEGFTQFLEAFREATVSKNLSKLSAQEREIAERLVGRGLVTDDPDRIPRWVAKMEMLREKKDQLARIFLKFTPFDLPYDYQARDDVRELYDSLRQSMTNKRNQSFLSKKTLEAERLGDLSELKLTNDEIVELENILMTT